MEKSASGWDRVLPNGEKYTVTRQNKGKMFRRSLTIEVYMTLQKSLIQNAFDNWGFTTCNKHNMEQGKLVHSFMPLAIGDVPNSYGW